MKRDFSTIQPALPSLLTVFFTYIGFSVTIPILADISMHMAEDIRYYWLTILMSAYPIGAIIGAPLVGSISDTLGRRHTLLLSLALSAVLYGLTGFVMLYQQWLLLAVIRMLQGCIDASMIIAQRTIADIVPQKQHSRFFSYLYSFPASAFILGPLVLSLTWQDDLNAHWSYVWPFLIQSILISSCFVMIFMTFSEKSQVKSSQNIKADLSQFMQIIRQDGKFRKVCYSNFFLFFVYIGFLRFYPIYIADYFNANIIVASQTISWVALGSLVTYLVINPFLFKVFKPKQMIIICGSALSICLLLTSNIQTLIGARLLLIIDSILVTIWIPACLSLISKYSSNQHYGKAFGQNQAIKTFAGLLINLVFPQMLALNKQLPLLCLSIAALGVAMIMSLNTTVFSSESIESELAH